ncbi:type III-B CRISPR module-associated protein Cmr5 [Methylomusa anaerophila]|uniref:CRISPR type III-B/RAMP module-associated protein Cmr5 n=1 Tax=Methylomusa anaerophila TaxID=1930071 RepID=A0A348AQY6_9FIRM|nr:type III-B CRISPR module-associated protein Cmr5 [Methylomusa anaerophila]BBB93484.1 CRISPR-associated protein [Methylomusa anaerophila]
MTRQNEAFCQIEEGRATFAFEQVKQAVEKLAGNAQSYKSYVRSLPSLIQVNGLGQALAFCYARKNKNKYIAYRDIYESIFNWLQRKFPDHFQQESELVEEAVKLRSEDYRMITMEVLALLNWMGRFAEGMIEDPLREDEEQANPSEGEAL